ncbi:hypothetical protein TSOC_004643 [Tetrabaena socialis]|uniref:Uncharacterized protein n=1 Tax=Tetrabaena socialis TaxID=47790 RepID=A0A2J8A8A6_9CHLO|nr:hypothetical protein TSOC_004643 [Tetrabaena socialis]|eukprot:PNH08764.1 hypothetical protein TSOC_004643 [Tetrabaena socialis]
MGLIRNLATAFSVAGLWVVGMPLVVRSRMDGYVERNLAAYDTRQREQAMEKALGGAIPHGGGHH